MILVQFAMLEVVCRARKARLVGPVHKKTIFDFKLAHFWQWDDFLR